MTGERESLCECVRQDEPAQIVTPKMNHVASLSASVALCGADLDPFLPAIFGHEGDVCCVVCAELWDRLTYGEKVALNRRWGGRGTSWEAA